jgi:hypothetical protein
MYLLAYFLLFWKFVVLVGDLGMFFILVASLDLPGVAV